MTCKGYAEGLAKVAREAVGYVIVKVLVSQDTNSKCPYVDFDSGKYFNETDLVLSCYRVSRRFRARED